MDEKQVAYFQSDYISAVTYFGNDVDDEPTNVGLKMESIYDQHFLISQMKVVRDIKMTEWNKMENTRENWADLLHRKINNKDFGDDGPLQFIFMPYKINPQLGMLILWNTETGFGASIGKVKRPDEVIRTTTVYDDYPKYTAMYHAN